MRRPLASMLMAALVTLALVSSARADLRVEHFDGSYLGSDGGPSVQAGSRPEALDFSFRFKTMEAEGEAVPDGSVKDLVVDLPLGIAGDFTQLPRCTTEQLLAMLAVGSTERCPIDSQVGVAIVFINDPDTPLPGLLPVFNMVPPPGTPADFGIPAGVITLRITPSVRTGEDYGIRATSRNTSSLVQIFGADVRFWGVPSDDSHDTERYPCGASPTMAKCPVTFPPFPLFTMPTSCTGPLRTILRADSWQQVGVFDSASFLSHDEVGNPYGLHGCEVLGFEPSLTARPEARSADTPTAVRFSIHLPQNDNPDGNATAHLKGTRITLPKGLTVNPASAGGLEGCTLTQVDLSGPDPARCPDASKIGTVRAHSPLIDNPLDGEIYVATPYGNPFGSLVAVYLSVDDPVTGVVAKFAGEGVLAADGQITAVFEDLPQFPIEDVQVTLFGGPRAALRTPPFCGTYTTRGVFTPWTSPHAPVVLAGDSFAINSGPGGSACARSEGERAHRPTFTAGTEIPIAGEHSRFLLDLRREDGSRELTGLELTPPPGLIAKLAGTTYCPEAVLAAAGQRAGRAEQSVPSCPASSRIGTVIASAGAGSAPYPVQGTAYLAGPYKGAPLSLAILTPAVAGPFDLGVVVVRSALTVDPVTARVRAVSDPLPTVLEGIPLDLRSATVDLDRPDFVLNPTNCEEMAVTGNVFAGAAIAPVSQRFQVGGCRGLEFKPRLSLQLRGGTRRADHPKLRAILTPRPGDANISRATISLPPSTILDNAHIRTICTRVQFAQRSCPLGSVYGRAKAWSPLLDQPLEGPVYLRSSSNPLPDIVFALGGQIEVHASARIDSTKAGGIRTNVDLVPDAPISRFVLDMQGGKKGLLFNSTNVCKNPGRAVASFRAHNGRRVNLRPKLQATSCGKKRSRSRSATRRWK